MIWQIIIHILQPWHLKEQNQYVHVSACILLKLWHKCDSYARCRERGCLIWRFCIKEVRLSRHAPHCLICLVCRQSFYYLSCREVATCGSSFYVYKIMIWGQLSWGRFDQKRNLHNEKGNVGGGGEQHHSNPLQMWLHCFLYFRSPRSVLLFNLYRLMVCMTLLQGIVGDVKGYICPLMLSCACRLISSWTHSQWNTHQKTHRASLTPSDRCSHTHR